MAIDEQDIAGKHGLVAGHVYQGVTLGVGGPDLVQLDGLVAHLAGRSAAEGFCRAVVFDPFEIEDIEQLLEKSAGFAHGARVAHDFCECGRRQFGHLFGAGCGRDNGRAFDQLIAVGVIAVGVGVDQGADIFRLRHGIAHDLQHLARQIEIKQRIDQQAVLAIGYQAGVGPAPRAVRLQVGVTALSQIVQPFGVLPFRHRHLLAILFVVTQHLITQDANS